MCKKRDVKNSGLIKIVLIIIFVSVLLITLCCIGTIIHLLKSDLLYIEKGVESTLLATGLSIIGMAISVWAGLNIINAFERNEYDSLKTKTQKIISDNITLKKELEQSKDNLDASQKEYAKAILVNEFSKTNKDAATRHLMSLIKDYIPEYGIPMFEIVKMEHYFSFVYEHHVSDFRNDIKLVNYATEGVNIAKKLLTITKNKNLETYLNYRIGDFEFYKGYCLEKAEKRMAFENAIEKYFKVANSFNANIPNYTQIEDINTFVYEECSSGQKEISAYMCNSIGEAYSKIIQGITDVDLIADYGNKAVFYCAYASHWANKEIYWRNLGVAIERIKGNCLLPLHYETVITIYKKAASFGCNEKTFKVSLSIMDKLVNYFLGIESVKPDVDREIKLSDLTYINKYGSLSSEDGNLVNDTLEDMHHLAIKAKAMFPSCIHGYIYNCLYWRDKAVITEDMELREQFINNALTELEFLMWIDSNGALTRILKRDINDLKSSITEK